MSLSTRPPSITSPNSCLTTLSGSIRYSLYKCLCLEGDKLDYRMEWIAVNSLNLTDLLLVIHTSIDIIELILLHNSEEP